MNNDELKQRLFVVINDRIKAIGGSQSQVAELLGVKQGVISRLKSCQTEKFSVSKLIDYAVLLGVEVTIKIGRKNIKL